MSPRKPKKPKPDDGRERGAWLTVKQLAAVIGVSHQAIRSGLLPHIPEDCQHREPGKAIQVYCPVAIRQYVARELSKIVGSGQVAPDAADAMDRYRRSKAQTAELALLRECGDVFPRALMLHVANLLRESFQRTADKYKQLGVAGAASMICEAIDDTRKVIDERFLGKGSVVRIEITPPGQSQPIELTFGDGPTA